MQPNTVIGQQFCANGGNRVCTVLMYLNDVSEGGCTFFSRLNLRVKPVCGMALIFFPGYEDGTLDETALHCAEDAVETKWVSQIWIRQGFRVPHQPSRPWPAAPPQPAAAAAQ